MAIVLAGRGRVGWLIAGALSVVTAGWALLNPGIYVGVIATATRPGALSQDLISVAAGLVLCGLALPRRRAGAKAELVALGLLGYLLYAYGIYVIERFYNGWYLNYLAIFGMAAWLGALGAIDIMRRTADRATLSRRVNRVLAVGALLQPLIFYPLWWSVLIPLMVHRDRIDSLYSIFILDLVFIMPAFLLVAVGLFRARGWAVLLAPVLFVLGRAVLLPRPGGAGEAGLRIGNHCGGVVPRLSHRAVHGLGDPPPHTPLRRTGRPALSPTGPCRSAH